MTKVLVITGTRADYGIYFPVLQKLEADPAIELQLLVTGMHLSPQYGYTIEHIRNDGFKIAAKVDCLLQASSHANMSRAIGIAILGMTQAMEHILPECVVVLGDRGEMLAAAIVAAHMNIPLVHLHGGEASGTIDESVRHAISKLAHMHLVATEGSRERLIRLGEDPWRIHVVGAPRIETMMNTVLPSHTEILRKYGMEHFTQYFLFVYHPVTNETTNLTELENMLKVLQSTGQPTIGVMPNCDAGADDMVAVYNRFAQTAHMHFVTSFEQLDYLVLLKYSQILIGNSSSGIIEAASFQVPVINVGMRQGRRERSDNVVDIHVDAEELRAAIQHVLSAPFQHKMKFINNVYGKENTSTTVLNLIKGLTKSDPLIQKTITY